jgi:hypothetical protein
VNYTIPAKPAQLLPFQDRPATRSVAVVADSAGEFPDASKQPPYAYVYRGELLEAVANDKRYRPQFNQQIDPQNRRAIDSYQRVAAEPPLVGQILDGFI